MAMSKQQREAFLRVYDALKSGEICKKAAAQQLGVCATTLDNWIVRNGLPKHPFIRWKTPQFAKQYKKWQAGKISSAEAATALGICRDAFHYSARRRIAAYGDGVGTGRAARNHMMYSKSGGRPLGAKNKKKTDISM